MYTYLTLYKNSIFSKKVYNYLRENHKDINVKKKI